MQEKEQSENIQDSEQMAYERWFLGWYRCFPLWGTSSLLGLRTSLRVACKKFSLQLKSLKADEINKSAGGEKVSIEKCKLDVGFRGLFVAFKSSRFSSLQPFILKSFSKPVSQRYHDFMKILWICAQLHMHTSLSSAPVRVEEKSRHLDPWHRFVSSWALVSGKEDALLQNFTFDLRDLKH